VRMRARQEKMTYLIASQNLWNSTFDGDPKSAVLVMSHLWLPFLPNLCVYIRHVEAMIMITLKMLRLIILFLIQESQITQSSIGVFLYIQ
jgi:hypothetical protein